jgi:type I restriction enzyme S subunit
LDKHSFPNGKRLVRDTLKPDDNLHYEKFSDGTVKCIEDEIPFELPDNWEWVRLGAICPYGDNKAIPSDSISESSWILDLEDIEKDIGLIKHYATKTERNSVSNKYAFTTGQLLYSKLRPYLNKVVIATKDGYCTTEILPLIFYGNISAKYMQIFMMSPTFLAYVNMISYGVKMPRLGTSDGKNALIAIPPINEQLRIREQFDIIIPLLRKIEKHSDTLHSNVLATKSKILDLAIRGKLVPQDPNDEPASILLERIRAEKEELIKQGKIKRDKKESVIFKGDDNSYYQDLPSNWIKIRLSTISEIITKGTTPRGGKVAYSQSGIGFLRAENIAGYDKLDLSNLNYIDEESHNNYLKRSILKENDILITIAGTLGRTAIVAQQALPLNTNQAVAIVRLVNNRLINVKYLVYALNSPIIKSDLLAKSVDMAIPNLSLENIADCNISLPPLSEQKRIVEAIEKIFAVLDDIANQVA